MVRFELLKVMFFVLVVTSGVTGCAGYVYATPDDATSTEPAVPSPAASADLTTGDSRAMDESEYYQNGKPKSWSQTGNLVTNNKTQIVTMQANDLDPGNYTVQLASNPPQSGAQATATITWTVNGNQVTRQVTVGTGTSVTGSGDSVRVIVQDASPTDFFPAGIQYAVTVSLAKGTRATTMAPPTLIPGEVAGLPGGDFNTGPGTYQVAAGSTINVPIPQGVGITTVWVSALMVGATPVVVDGHNTQCQFQNTGTTYGVFPPNLGNWVPVPAGATSLAIQNTSAANIIFYYVAYGIDG